MSCDCASAPALSGPCFANLIKGPLETVEQTIDWCAVVADDAAIVSSDWTVEPDTSVTTPLVAGSQGAQGAQTSAIISGGNPGQLYRAQNLIGAQGPQAPVQNFVSVVWVYVPLDNAPSVFTACEGV